ncbi:MAG: Flp pilus assembly protein CpaB [Microthrixaceae bacterium]
MSSRRTLILIGAVVIGGLAAVLVLSYVRGVESRSDEANQLVKVAVAAGPIPKGTAADAAVQAQQITLADRRRQDVPASAVKRFADIQGQVAAVDLSGGEIITTSMFKASTAPDGSKSQGLSPGRVAMSISLDEAATVGGNLNPGDFVNVLARTCGASADGSQAADCSLQRTGAAAGAVTLGKPATYVLQNVKVYGVGANLGEQVAAAQPADGSAPSTTAPAAKGGIVTLELTPEQAQLLASVRDADLYLTLNPPGYAPVPVPFTNSFVALPGELGENASGAVPGPAGQ